MYVLSKFDGKVQKYLRAHKIVRVSLKLAHVFNFMRAKLIFFFLLSRVFLVKMENSVEFLIY